MERMKDKRLEWWKKQQRSGKLGHNFECLIRDFQTERDRITELETRDKAAQVEIDALATMGGELQDICDKQTAQLEAVKQCKSISAEHVATNLILGKMHIYTLLVNKRDIDKAIGDGEDE